MVKYKYSRDSNKTQSRDIILCVLLRQPFVFRSVSAQWFISCALLIHHLDKAMHWASNGGAACANSSARGHIQN